MKVLTAHLADDKQMLLLTVCQLLFCQFQYVVIVRTCQTFICRDDEKCLFPIRLCICPGTIGIAITNTLWTDDSAMKGLLAHIPLGRQAVPDEIAAPTVFVCSDYASYMTGAVITVDGGWTAGGYARNF